MVSLQNRPRVNNNNNNSAGIQTRSSYSKTRRKIRTDADPESPANPAEDFQSESEMVKKPEIISAKMALEHIKRVSFCIKINIIFLNTKHYEASFNIW